MTSDEVRFSEPGSTKASRGLHPLHDPRFVRAAEHLGPGRGRGLVLTHPRERVTWAITERSALLARAAVAHTAPEIPEGGDRSAIWADLLEGVASRGNVALVMNSHATLRLTPEDLEALRRVAAGRGWLASGGRFGTFVLDLTKSEAARYEGMHKSHQRNVRRGDKEGLTLDRLPPGKVDEFITISDALYARQGLTGPKAAYFRGLAEMPETFRFYVARDASGEAVAGLVIACAHGTAISMHGGGGARNVRFAGSWLDWRLKCALANEGFRRYDLGGVDLDSHEPKATGIREFKERFGGDLEVHEWVEVAFAPVRFRLIRTGLEVVRSVKVAAVAARAAAQQPTSASARPES